MRLLFATLWLLSQCSPAPPPRGEGPPSPPPAAAAASAQATLTADTADTSRQQQAPGDPPQRPAFRRSQLAGITFSGVSFDSRSHQLVVVDQPAGPGSRFGSAAAAAASRGALAAVNGGFFTPQGAPLGMVIAGGRKSGHWNRASSLGSGIFHEGSDGRPALTRRSGMSAATAATMKELLQSGPFLVNASKPVAGLDQTKRRQRSVILWDGGHRWWIGCSSNCSLDTLARSLSRNSPAGWPVHHALNLDGGSSCDLWVAARITGKRPFQLAFWPRPVRNHLLLIERPPNAH